MKKAALVLVLVLALAAPGLRSQSQVQTQTKIPNTGKIPSSTNVLAVDIEMTDVFLDHCRVWVRFTNVGTAAIDKNLKERIWVDDVQKDESVMHVVLAPGALFAHAVGADPGLSIAGAHTVRATIDGDNALNETAARRANNTKSASLNCALSVQPPVGQIALPDLTVAMDFKAMTHNDSSGQMVYSCDIQFTVSNGGAGAAGPCKILLEQISGPSGGAYAPCGPEISVPAVPAHQSVTVTSGPYKHTGPAPTYRATVDCHNAVTETNETNNTATKKMPG